MTMSVSLKISLYVYKIITYLLCPSFSYLFSYTIEKLAFIQQKEEYHAYFKMTISYGQQVATSSGLGVFWKLLFIWKGKQIYMKIGFLIYNEFIQRKYLQTSLGPNCNLPGALFCSLINIQIGSGRIWKSKALISF